MKTNFFTGLVLAVVIVAGDTAVSNGGEGRGDTHQPACHGRY